MYGHKRYFKYLFNSSFWFQGYLKLWHALHFGSMTLVKETVMPHFLIEVSEDWIGDSGK